MQPLDVATGEALLAAYEESRISRRGAIRAAADWFAWRDKNAHALLAAARVTEDLERINARVKGACESLGIANDFDLLLFTLMGYHSPPSPAQPSGVACDHPSTFETFPTNGEVRYFCAQCGGLRVWFARSLLVTTEIIKVEADGDNGMRGTAPPARQARTAAMSDLGQQRYDAMLSAREESRTLRAQLEAAQEQIVLLMKANEWEGQECDRFHRERDEVQAAYDNLYVAHQATNERANAMLARVQAADALADAYAAWDGAWPGGSDQVALCEGRMREAYDAYRATKMEGR